MAKRAVNDYTADSLIYTQQEFTIEESDNQTISQYDETSLVEAKYSLKDVLISMQRMEWVTIVSKPNYVELFGHDSKDITNSKVIRLHSRNYAKVVKNQQKFGYRSLNRIIRQANKGLLREQVDVEICNIKLVTG